MLRLPKSAFCAKVAELVDALDLGSSGATRESSSLSFRTKFSCNRVIFPALSAPVPIPGVSRSRYQLTGVSIPVDFRDKMVALSRLGLP